MWLKQFGLVAILLVLFAGANAVPAGNRVGKCQEKMNKCVTQFGCANALFKAEEGSAKAKSDQRCMQQGRCKEKYDECMKPYAPDTSKTDEVAKGLFD